MVFTVASRLVRWAIIPFPSGKGRYKSSGAHQDNSTAAIVYVGEEEHAEENALL